MLTKTTPKDMSLALAATVAGGVALLVAQRAHWRPGDMSPGIEGCLTATTLAFILVLLHPLRYAHACALSVPFIVAEYVACAYSEGPGVGLAVVGMHLVFMGFVGVALARREPQGSAPAPRSSRSIAQRPVSAHS
jgi:hypothetical protein